MHFRINVLIALVAAVFFWRSAEGGNEPEKVVERLLAPPVIKTEKGFKATLLVAPGHMFDPLSMVPHGDSVWINDDGGEDGDRGGMIFAVSPAGIVSTLVDVDRLLPIVGMDVAPPSFGAYAGRILAFAQPRVGPAGGMENHVIMQIDPKSHAPASRICTLPSYGSVNGGIAGDGALAHMGKPGSPFAGKFFAVALLNGTIYQMGADGVCKPFVTFDGKPWGAPLDFAFSSDGSRMLVSVAKGNFSPEDSDRQALAEPPAGAVVAVSPEGIIDERPIVVGLHRPSGVAVAPLSMRGYGGDLFVVDIGEMQGAYPLTHPLKADGRLFRVGRDGTLHLVASGLVNPMGISLIGGAIWVADVNADFIGGRELPDGFVVKIEAE